MRFNRFRLIVGCFGLLGCLFLAACGGGNQTDADGEIAQILKLGNGAEPKGLDPHLVTGVTENKIIQALIEGLIAYHPTDDNLPEAGVAERWEHNEDYSVWTFYLNPEARWTTGDAVTAEDFVYSWQRILSPELGAEYANMLYVMKNAEAYNKGELTDFSQVGVKALDEGTLEVTLIGPTPYFLSMLKHYSWFPVHPGTIEEHGGMTARSSRWTRPENYVGNGAFVLTEWVPNQIIRVSRNPQYWDAEKVRLDEIHFYPVNDPNTEERMFLSGRLHVANSVSSAKIPWFRENRPDIIRLEPYLGVYFYRFNTTRPPFDNPKVRLALSMAIDQESIVKTITQGDQTPAHGFTPVGMMGYETPSMVKFDPQRAQELLAEAGFPGGEGFPEKEILYNTLEDHKRIAEAVQQMWKEHLGIDVTLVNQEWKVYLDSQVNLQYDISRSAWIGDFMDPITFLDMWTTGNGNNNTGWSNAEFDRHIREAQEAGDPAVHYAKLKQAEEIFLNERPVAPMYWYTRIYLKSPLVRNWSPKLLDNRPYKHIYLAAEE